MTNNDFKQILDESIKPLQHGINKLQKDLDGVKQDLNGVKEDLSGVKQDLNGVKEDIQKIKKDQTELRKVVEERVLPSVIYIETTIKGYADSYITNKDHIGRLNKRLGTVEENLGIQPPEELTIPHFN